jgi:hypothetical protein
MIHLQSFWYVRVCCLVIAFGFNNFPPPKTIKQITVLGKFGCR